MSRKTRLLGMVLLLFTDVCWGQYPSSDEAALPFTGTTIPEPPRQKDAWKPPASKVPDDFVKAATRLFKQDLADPRACEYRVITLTNGECTHAWVLPAKDGDKRRFAVTWNGLVCLVASLGDKADLKKDVRAREESAPVLLVQNFRLGDLPIALLLRLGEGALASELWAVNHPAPAAGDNTPMPQEPDPLLSLTETLTWAWFNRSLDAHESGDDALALLAFRKLKADQRDFYFLWQLPALLADQERRAKEKRREAIVCFGPGRDPDPKKRIAALVLRLDEVVGRSDFPGTPYIGSDPIVLALVHEGSQAVEPLLKCFEDDRRLTRAVSNTGRWRAYYTCQSVQEAAYVALAAILNYSPRSPEEKESRKELAARFREHFEKTKNLTPAERRFQVLADDKAHSSNSLRTAWQEAAEQLMSLDPATPSRTIWSSRSPSASSDDKRQLLAESLRGKRNPSVTELLVKRIEQSEPGVASYLALNLAAWEPKAGLKPLTELTKRLRQTDEHQQFIAVLETRYKLGDRRALDDYVAFIRMAHPKMLCNFEGLPDLFDPMVEHPDHPGMAKAAEELFADEKSPWLPLFQMANDDDDNDGQGDKPFKLKCTPRVFALIPTPLLRLPAFRNAVLKELGNKKKISEVLLDRKEDIKQDCRVCDFCASMIGEQIKCAPRCELSWTEAERDQAVAACVAFLRRQQYELEWRSDALSLDQPATAEQVEKGQAVFSLVSEEKTVRVVAGLMLPLRALWSTPKFDRLGKVVQAEEVFKEGHWRRYYGFIGANYIVRVPAEEIDFSPDDPSWEKRRYWVRVGPSLHVGLNVPPLEIESFDALRSPLSEGLSDGFPPRLPLSAPLTFSLTVRNAAGVDQPTPDASKIVKIRLLYSPEIISRQGALVPKAQRDTDWAELKAKPGAQYTPEEKKTLNAAQERQLAAFKLGDWFDLSQPGFYRLQWLPADGKPDAAQEIGEVRFSLAAPQPKAPTAPKP